MIHSITELYKWHLVFVGALAMALAITAKPSPRGNGSQFYE